MLTEIIKHTPYWVFILFFALLWLGYAQGKTRIVARDKIFLLPIAMSVLSLYSIFSAFGSTTAMLYGLAGAVAAVFLGSAMVAPKGIFYSEKSDAFYIPGSWLPMFLMMAIFFTKYAVGATFGLRLPLAARPEFMVSVSLLYGFYSGLFIARAVGIWRSAKSIDCRAADLPDSVTAGALPQPNGIRSFLGYIWAISALFIVLATFMGNKVLSAKLAEGTGVKVSAWHTGGEIIKTIEHKGYRTIIHRPVFDGLLSDRRQGFIQVNLESDQSLPSIINEKITPGTDSGMDFNIHLETGKGKLEITSESNMVQGTGKCIRLKNGWAVRVLLEKS